MSSLAEMTGAVGTVEVCGKLLTLMPLSIAEETVIYKRLESMAVQDADKRIQDAYRIAAMAPTPEMRAVAVQRIIDSSIEGRKPVPSVVYRYWETPKGCAFDLWMRAKKAHPEIKLDEVEAIVTDTNAEQVFLAIQEAVKDPKAVTVRQG